MSLSTLSIAELWHLAKSQYHRADYQPAIQTFLIISKKDSASLDLLEYLASTYSKLSKWEDALKWGRHAISLEPRNARGYLCVGKILQRMGQKKRAIAIYDVGHAKVLPMDANFEKLLKVRDQATGTEAKASNRDPMEVLPAELLLSIFQCVGFREMVKCIRVSKGWRSFLNGFPELWRIIDLSKAKPGRIKAKFIKSCIKNSAYTLETANLGGYSDFKMYLDMAKCCRSLRVLEIPSSCALSVEAILQVIEKLKSIEKLTLDVNMRIAYLPHLLGTLPRMQELRLLNLKWQFNNTIDTWGLPNNFPPKSQALKLLECRISSSGFVRGLQTPMHVFEGLSPENLPSAEIFMFDNLNPGHPFTLDKWQSLKQLQLSNCDFIGNIWLPPNLTDLMISGVNGKDLFPQHLKLLKRFEIGNCKMPQLVIKKLLNEEPLENPEQEDLDQGNIWRQPDLDLNQSMSRQTILNRLSDDTEILAFSKLKTFKIESRLWLSDAYNQIMRRQDDLEETLTHPRLSEVENLVLKGGGVDDNVIESVILDDKNTFTRCLEQIAFDSTRISSTTLRLLIENQEHLKAIWLVNCDGVGEDAVEWAQSKGVDVQIRRRG